MNTTTILNLRPWLAALVLASACPQLHATDFHVVTAQALQSALFLAANNGANNNIYLTNGNYAGNFNYNSSQTNDLTLLAEPGLTNTGITIDGAGVGSGLTISASAGTNTITVKGISFAVNSGNGDGSVNNNNGALVIGAGSRATILVSGCQFFSPTNGVGDGLIIVSGWNVTVDGCTAVGAKYGIYNGGVFGGHGMVLADRSNSTNFAANVSVVNCTFLTNQNSGLAISTFGNFVTVSNNIFAGNWESGCGVSGGLVLGGFGLTSKPTVGVLSQNTFNGNGGKFPFGGSVGGASVVDCVAVTLTGNTFTTNSGAGAASAQPGGGLLLFGNDSVTLTGNSFIGNSANSTGGGVAVVDGGAGSDTNLTITGNNFIGNTAAANNFGFFSGGGGAVYVNLAAATVTVQANTFKQNKANSAGGALYVLAPTVTISDNLVAGNAQTNAASTGGGVWVDASSNLFFINNTITTNISAGGGGGSAFQINGTVEVLNVFNNIFWGNSGTSGADVWVSGIGKKRVFSYNDANGISGVWDLFVNNLDIDPQFVSPTSGDYHLLSTSPCHNAGTIVGLPLPALDLDGNPRIVSNLIDMGCYQFLPRLQIKPTTTNSFVLQWPSSTGQTYEIDQSTNLVQGFQVLIPSISPTPPTNQVNTTAVPGANAAFYRLKVY